MRTFFERVCITLWIIWCLCAGLTILVGMFGSGNVSLKDITMGFCGFSFVGICISLFQYLLIGIFNPLNLFE